MDNNVLEMYYGKYLKEIRSVKESSVKHYKDALKFISNFLKNKGIIEDNVYEIQDLEGLSRIKTFLYNDPEFIEVDNRGHRMYSVGFNHYYKFANGEGFSNIQNQIEVMDFSIPVPGQENVVVTKWKRSSIIKIQSIESAGYKCEFDNNHQTFTSKSTNHPYMEGHHAIPIQYQKMFTHSLDVYANVVCLCPICHRLLHHGIETEKEVVINKIYYDRSERLAKSGIEISKDDFIKLVI